AEIGPPQLPFLGPVLVCRTCALGAGCLWTLGHLAPPPPKGSLVVNVKRDKALCRWLDNISVAARATGSVQERLTVRAASLGRAHGSWIGRQRAESGDRRLPGALSSAVVADGAPRDRTGRRCGVGRGRCAGCVFCDVPAARPDSRSFGGGGLS